MDMRWCVAAAMLASMPAWSQQVYKCAQVAQGAGPVYQSEPCSGKILRAWDATPDPVDPAVQQRLRQIDQQLWQRNRPSSQRQARSRVSTRKSASVVSPCEREKLARTAAFEAAGMKRTFALTRRWDDRVAKACR